VCVCVCKTEEQKGRIHNLKLMFLFLQILGAPWTLLNSKIFEILFIQRCYSDGGSIKWSSSLGGNRKLSQAGIESSLRVFELPKLKRNLDRTASGNTYIAKYNELNVP